MEDEAADPGKLDSGASAGETFRLQIAHGAYPAAGARPNVLVYVPHGHDAGPPLQIVVFLHGWNNCVDNVVAATNTACAGGAVRNAYRLAAQLETSQRNAILVVPELRFDQASSDPGALGQPRVFASLIDDTLAAMSPRLGKTLADLGGIVVASHSGGYLAAASIVRHGGLPVDELWLLDSLYGQFDDFASWTIDPDTRTAVTASPFTKRFVDVYTGAGGTMSNSIDLAQRLDDTFPGLLDDRTTRTLGAADYANGVIVKHSALPHDGVPRYYMATLLTSSSLRVKPVTSP